MCVYKDLRFLGEAVGSILQQHFSDFEFIIVDDGTGDETVQRLAMRDPRIKVVVNERNVGAAAASNRGIAEAQSDIIVRLDADDVAEPTHIGRLVADLERDPDLGLVGSSVRFIDEEGRLLGAQGMPETDVDVRWTILFHNPFYHSSVAFRRSCFEAAGPYKESELISHDHFLWFSMLDVCRAHNIAEPLLRYRINPRGLTGQPSKNPRGRTHAIREKLWARLGLNYDLYDNVLAADISGVLRGNDIEPLRRGPAYDRMLTVLLRFAAMMQPLARDEDRASLRRLTRGLASRVLDSPPALPHELDRVMRLCSALEL